MGDDESAIRSVRERTAIESQRFGPADEHRLKRWFLFDGDRERVAAALLGCVFTAMLILGGLWPVGYEELLSETTMVQEVFTTLLSGTILLVSIVASIAAVGISQELTSLGDQFDRVDTTIDFQSQIEARGVVDVSPLGRASSPPSSSTRFGIERTTSSASTEHYKLELSDLSTTLLTVSLPIIVFISYVLLAVDSGFFPDVTVVTYSPLTIVISLAYTIALAPYAVLTSYVFRAATVTKRTPEEGPFVLDPERRMDTDRAFGGDE